MGNTSSINETKILTQKFESYIIREFTISSKTLVLDTKLFKTYQSKLENDTQIIIKLYLRGDKQIDLVGHGRNFQYYAQQVNMSSHSNVLPYTKYVTNEEDFAMVIRQCGRQTLQDRLHTVPGLTQVEKKWLIFQVLCGVYSLHHTRLFHGNLKTSNILLTSSNHVFITDIASYKPLYIYEDDLTTFNIFFSSHSTQCNLAPEKFIPRDTTNTNINVVHDISQLNDELLYSIQKQDIFALGCVLADIYISDTQQPLFTYELIQKYRKDQFNPLEILQNKIEDSFMRQLIISMIQLEPNKRETVQQYLEQFIEHYYSLPVYPILYYINSALISNKLLIPDLRLALIRNLIPLIYINGLGLTSPPLHYENLPFPLQFADLLQTFEILTSDNAVDMDKLAGIDVVTLVKQYKEKGEKFISNEIQGFNCQLLSNSQNLQTNLLDQISKQKKNKNIQQQQQQQQNEGVIIEKKYKMVNILIKMIVSNIRNVKYLQSKFVGIEMIENFAKFLSESDCLHNVFPLLFWLFDDENPRVVEKSFLSFCEILKSFKQPPKKINDIRLYRDSILPNLNKLVQMKDISITIKFAENFHILIEAAQKFYNTDRELILPQYSINSNTNKEDENDEEYETTNTNEIPHSKTTIVTESPDTQRLQAAKDKLQSDLEYINKTFHSILQNYFSGQLKESESLEAQEAIVKNIYNICRHFDKSIFDSNIIHLYVSAFNKTKIECLKAIPNLSRLFSERQINDVIKLCLEMTLQNQDYIVVKLTLSGFKAIAKQLTRENTEQILQKCLPFTLHPNQWIREEAINLIEEILINADLSDIFCFYQKLIQPYLSENIPLIMANSFKKFIHTHFTYNLYQKLLTNNNNTKILLESPKKELISLFLSNLPPNYRITDTQQSSHYDDKKNNNMNNLKIKDQSLFSTVIHSLGTTANDFWISAVLYDVIRFSNQAITTLHNPQSILHTYLNIDASESNQFSSLKVKRLSDMRLKIDLGVGPQFDPNETHKPITSYLNFQNALMHANTILLQINSFNAREEFDLGLFARETNEKLHLYLKSWKPTGLLLTTIQEHVDVVSSIDVMDDNRYFFSGSYDGTVKMYDMERIERDFSTGSVLTMRIKSDNETDQKKIMKVKNLKVIDNCSSFICGVEKSLIDLYRIDVIGGAKATSEKRALLRRYNVNGEVKSIQTLQNQYNDRCFSYVTHSGELGIEDLRCKSAAVRYNLGKERGMITTMLYRSNKNSLCVGTLDGFILQFDLRYCLVNSVFQLKNQEKSQGLPIFSLSEFYPYSRLQDLPTEDLLLVSYASDNHEMCVFSLSETQPFLQPYLYFVSTQKNDDLLDNPYLFNHTQNEKDINVSYSYQERTHYQYLTTLSPQEEIIDFMRDPLQQSSTLLKDRLMQNSTNRFSVISSIHKYKNTVLTTISLPKAPNLYNNQLFYQKGVYDNIILSAGTDASIHYWNLNSTEPRCLQVSSHDHIQRAYETKQVADLTVVQEYYYNESTDKNNNSSSIFNSIFQTNEKTHAKGLSDYSNKNGYYLNIDESKTPTKLAQANHRDAITNLAFIDRGNSAVIISAGRDASIKLWK